MCAMNVLACQEKNAPILMRSNYREQDVALFVESLRLTCCGFMLKVNFIFLLRLIVGLLDFP